MIQQVFFQQNAAIGGGIPPASDFILAGLSVFSAATDLWKGKVYNAVTVPGLFAGLVFSAWRSGAVGLLDVLCAVGFTVLVLYPFYKAGGLGAGDIKLLAAVSAFMPSMEYLNCFAAAFVVGAAAGVIRLMCTRGTEHRIHFAVPVAASVLLHLAGIY